MCQSAPRLPWRRGFFILKETEWWCVPSGSQCFQDGTHHLPCGGGEQHGGRCSLASSDHLCEFFPGERIWLGWFFHLIGGAPFKLSQKPRPPKLVGGQKSTARLTFCTWQNCQQLYVERSTTDSVQFSSVQSLSRVQLFATPWIAACQASLSITNSRSSLRLMSIESVMPSSHLILCRSLLLLPPIPPSIRVF